MKGKVIIFSAMTTIVAVVAAIAINFTACKKEFCSNCVAPPPDLVESVTFNLMDKSIKKDCKIYQRTLKDGSSRESLLQEGKSENYLLDFIKEYCHSKNIPVDEQTMSIVLYYNEPVSQTFAVTDENIRGISLYYINKKKIMHLLFMKNEQSEFYAVENTKVPVLGVTSNHINYYLENYVFKDPQNKSYINISGNLAVDVWKNRNKYKRPPLQFELRISKKQVRPQGATCGGDCAAGGGICLAVDDGYGTSYGCVLTGCVGAREFSILSEANMVERMFFDLDLMYTFRDDFLYNSEKGEDYIYNYYLLSEEYQNSVGIPLALQTALFFKNFNPVMEAFVNPENHLTEVMFTDELTNSLLNLLDKYENITTSSEGKAALSSIRADINSFRNKQLKDVLAMFE